MAESPIQPEQAISKPKAILFDLLTALDDSWTIWNTSIPPAEQQVCDGTTWRKRYLELTYACGSYKPYESLVEQAAKDVGLSEKAPQALVRDWDQVLPWPEAPQVLARLRRRGFKLAVATNCSNELGHRAVSNCERVVRENTEEKDFAFDAVVTAEECGFYKPDPKPYQDTLKKLNVGAGDALFVAGSSSDIPGASGVGMKVIWHNRIGLARKNNLLPLREGQTLDEALHDILEA